MNAQRFCIFFIARLKELLRDPGTLVWSLVFPLLLISALAVFVKGGDPLHYTVGVIAQPLSPYTADTLPGLKQPYIQPIEYASIEHALQQLQHHQLDLVLSPTQYWVNPRSHASLIAERLLFAETAPAAALRVELDGSPIRYLDWVVTGVLGLVIMHSCLFGVGWAIVRQRKQGVLKRLHSTPLTPAEFIGAHLLARLLWLGISLPVLYLLTHALFDFYMVGSYWLLTGVFVLSSIVMLALALLAASRSANEEQVLAYLNLITWPMVLLSGAWFSLQGAPAAVTLASWALPLTHTLTASRAIMLEDAGLATVWPQIAVLSLMALTLLSLACWRFKW